eukprot:1699040-Pyramimonas_sp.AAC.1
MAWFLWMLTRTNAKCSGARHIFVQAFARPGYVLRCVQALLKEFALGPKQAREGSSGRTAGSFFKNTMVGPWTPL